MDQVKENQEWHIVIIASFVIVLFCSLLNFILYAGLIDRVIFSLYFLGFTLLPLILYGIDRYSGFFTKTGGITISGWIALLLNALFCLKMASSPGILNVFSSVFTLMMAYFCLIVLRQALFKNNTIEVSSTPAIKIAASAVVLAIVLLGFWNTFVEHMWFDAYDGIAIEIPHWGGWPAAIVVMFAVLSGYVLGRLKAKSDAGHSGWTLAVCLSPLLLFSVQSAFDLDHYDAFVGPAIAVLHGRIPLMDVFSQYGLGYLLFTMAFLVLPNTYAVCASIVSLVNIGAFVVYLLILRILIKNPFQFSLIGIVSVFGVYFSNEISMNVFPSAVGFRYLPAMLFVYFLISERDSERNKLNEKVNFFILCLNAFWSIECLIFYCLIAGFYRWLMTYSIRSVFVSIFRLFYQLLFVFLVFFTLYFLLFKQFPNYNIYLEHPLSYLSGRHDEGSFTKRIEQFTGRYLFFVPPALMSITLFFWSIFISKKKSKCFTLNSLYLVNFSGVIFFVYIAIHSFVYHLKMQWILFLPIFFGTIFFVKEESENDLFKFLSIFVAWVTCVIFFCVFVVRIVYLPPSNVGVNDALIYHLIHFKKEVFKNFWYNINNFCNYQNYKKDNNSRIFFRPYPYSCKKYGFHNEIKSIVEKYYKNTNKSMIFSVSAVEVLFENHKFHPIFVNPMNDVSVDATQYKLVEQKVNNIKNGDIVIVEKGIGLDRFQADILRMLWKKFGFYKIDETPNLKVFKLTNKVSNGSPWFLNKTNFVSYLGKNGFVNYREPLNMKNVDLQNYFYHGDVMTIEMDFDQPFLVNAIKFWHLFNTKDILKYRFFSDDQIKNFNVLVSEDRKKWDMLISESNYFVSDKKYYYKDIAPIKTKYVRLNILMDNPRIMIPNLEIFGTN